MKESDLSNDMNDNVNYAVYSNKQLVSQKGNYPYPFNFNFNGTLYSTCNVNSNGYITFGATAPTTNGYTPISSSTAYAGAVAAFARDLVNNGTAISYTTLNSSPNRIFIVEWKNARRSNAGAVSGDVVNFQIRLYETSNVTRPLPYSLSC